MCTACVCALAISNPYTKPSPQVDHPLRLCCVASVSLFHPFSPIMANKFSHHTQTDTQAGTRHILSTLQLFVHGVPPPHLTQPRTQALKHRLERGANPNEDAEKDPVNILLLRGRNVTTVRGRAVTTVTVGAGSHKTRWCASARWKMGSMYGCVDWERKDWVGRNFSVFL